MATSFTAIVDYGVGNLRSLENAMRYLGLNTEITGDVTVLERASAVILPGVGAFDDAAERLRASELGEQVKKQAKKKPVLGICLGMQLLFDESDEGRGSAGLGLISGRVKKIQTAEKLPHIGWNSLRFPQPLPLFEGIFDGAAVYFVHSFCADPARAEDAAAYTDYGAQIVAAVRRGNVFGCQFHPEKSGEIGLQILKNFGGLTR